MADDVIYPSISAYDGCPVLTKQQALLVPKGTAPEIAWIMRKPADGLPWAYDDLIPGSQSLSFSVSSSNSAVPEDGHSIQVRILPLDYNPQYLQVYEATPWAPEDGVIRLRLDAKSTCHCGIWNLAVGILDASGTPVRINNGLLSVERGLWGDLTQRDLGPPSLQELRMHIRDTAVENADLWQAQEFDDNEIVQALVRPLQYWNEVPPPIPPFQVQNFPFRYQWLNAAVGELLMTAAHHYTRNKLQMQHGGLTGDELDRDKEYLQLAMKYQQEWRDFVTAKKCQINYRRGFGTLSSSYRGVGAYTGWGW